MSQAEIANVVAIVETDVFGALGYHAHCTTCDKRVCATNHDKEATAVRHAKAHRCAKEK